jgi:hypothetical protein
MIKSVLTAASAAIICLGLAPLAHADTDSDFLAALRTDNIAPMDNGQGLIANAHTMCQMLSSGMSWQTVNDKLYGAESQPPDPMSHEQVNFEENAAIKFYCPNQ